MTLAYFLVVAAVLAVVSLFYLGISQNFLVRSDATLAPRIQPIDIEAFRNLMDPAEREYLRSRLPGGEFREVQRRRLVAMAAYVRTARQNATILIDIRKASFSADRSAAPPKPRASSSTMRIRSRRNAFIASCRIWAILAVAGFRSSSRDQSSTATNGSTAPRCSWDACRIHRRRFAFPPRRKTQSADRSLGTE